MPHNPARTPATPGRPSRLRIGTAVRWTLQVALAAFLGLAGGSKLAGDPRMLALFAAVGAGQWLRYATGGLELLGAVLLLIPRGAGVGALLLAAVMAGAAAAHLFVIGGSPAVPLALGAVAAGLAFVRRATLRATLRVPWRAGPAAGRGAA